MGQQNQPGGRPNARKVLGAILLGALTYRPVRDPLAVFFALFIGGMFFYGMWTMVREGDHEKHLNALHQRIVTHVKQHPEVKSFTLDALQTASIVSSDDMKFMKSAHIAYRPVGAADRDDAV